MVTINMFATFPLGRKHCGGRESAKSLELSAGWEANTNGPPWSLMMDAYRRRVVDGCDHLQSSSCRGDGAG